MSTQMLKKFCFLIVGFFIDSSVQDCRIQNIYGSIVGCNSNGADINNQALPVGTVPGGTVCSLRIGTEITDVHCDGSVWKLHGSHELSLSPAVRRIKRSFFGVLKCIVTLFSCLWAGRGHSDRTAPSVICQSPGKNFVNDRLQNYVPVTWQHPTANDDEDGHITPKRMSGWESGMSFPDGQHIITYEAKDRAGNRGTCDIIITVKVTRCKIPEKIANGYYRCFPNVNYVYGSSCQYHCYEGFEIKGKETVTCERTGQWSSSTPICGPIKCAPLPTIDDSLPPDCSNGYNFRSICSYNCKTGYDVPSGVSKALVCSKTRSWRQHGDPKCIDVEPPEFSSCPNTLLRGSENGINSTIVNWKPPSVADNSNNARALIQNGMPSGSIFTAGSHQIEYSAEDVAGNKALYNCSFKVIVRDIRCPRLFPTPYLHFNCPNGYRSGTRCDVSCDPGKALEGTNGIGCQRSRIGQFGEWNWLNGEQSRCINTRACSPIPPPSNGAVVCDNWEGGQFCQVQCRNGTEMSSVNLNKLYACKMNGEWSSSPPGDRTCRTKRTAVLAFGIVATYYFSGECTDETTQQQIAHNFISTLQNSVLYQPEACPDSIECNKDNVQITCGQSTRKKRALESTHINGSYIQLNIRVPFTIQDVDIDAVKYLEMYENISQILMNNTADIFGKVQVTPVDVTSTGVQVQCPTGSVKSEQSLSCVDCTEGTCYRIQIGKPYCESCRKGTYQERAGESKCIQCPYNTTTRTVGAVSLQQCIDACPPGSYSKDGTVPCSPCEQGYYQTSFGQMNCRACNGSKSTLSFGATSMSSCEEFDIEFMPEELSEIRLNFRENISISDFTLSTWLKINTDKNYTADVMTISFIDDNNDTVWMWGNLQEILSADNQAAHTELVWLDTKWHHVVLYRKGCIYSVQMDGIPYVVQAVAGIGNCFSTVFNTLTITTDTSSMESLSMFNIWHGERSKNYQHRCSIGEVGDVVSWKNMIDSHLSGAYIHIPSQCDDVDDCSSSPCLHGSCKDVFHGYKCTCDTGYVGTGCNTNEDDCILNVCMNNATCLDGVSTYTCVCPPLVTGKYCEIEQVDGNWNEWESWSACSTTCGNGTKHRHRLCNNPTPDNGGNDCTGDNNESEECQNAECPVCPTLVPPTNGYLNCENGTENFNCIILCNDGYVFDIEPLPLYFCGPETFQVWNFETDENPDRRLPKCIKVQLAEKLSVVYTAYYRDLYCDTQEYQHQANVQIESTLDSMINRLPCMMKRTCELKKLHIVNCHEDIRERRSINNVGFNLEITTSPINDSTNESLSDLKQSFQEVQAATDNGTLTVNVLDDDYVIDGSLTNITGTIDCGYGKTRVDHYCVPCGRGSYLNGDICTPCPVGTYQDEEGQQGCITCPNGKSTVGMFSESIDECTVDALSNTDIMTPNVTGIVVGCVTGLVVILIAMVIVYIRHRSKMYSVIKTTEIDMQARENKPEQTNSNQHVMEYK